MFDRPLSMLKPRLIFALFVLVSSEVLSQPLQMHKTLGGAHFMRDTVYLSHRHVSEILSVDPQASEEFKVAIKNYRIGGILGFSGAILLAVPVVTALSGGEPEWLMAGGGGVLLLASIPFSRTFKARSETAIRIFNEKHAPATGSMRYRNSPRSKLYFNGASVTLKF
jgi:hypothetical protein